MKEPFLVALYTIEEGGYWIPFPTNQTFVETDIIQLDGEDLIILGGIKMHSFKTTTDKEWDAINHWRKP